MRAPATLFCSGQKSQACETESAGYQNDLGIHSIAASTTQRREPPFNKLSTFLLSPFSSLSEIPIAQLSTIIPIGAVLPSRAFKRATVVNWLSTCDVGHTLPGPITFRTVPIGMGQPVTGTARPGSRLHEQTSPPTGRVYANLRNGAMQRGCAQQRQATFATILSNSASPNSFSVVVRTFPFEASDRRYVASASSLAASTWMIRS